jgi:spore germination cell wall hydrolase CwlJ-like protein
MNRQILALLFTIAQTVTAGTAPVDGDNNFNAPAERVSAVDYHFGAGLSASATPGGPGEVRAPALQLAAASILPWTHKIMAFLDARIVEQSCLARAVYFEARSESRQGQLAVAMVILNRVKASKNPSSICRVVYQGSSRLNACQFSFACDGKPDLPKHGRAWETALAVTALALADGQEMADERMRIVSTATHYHADYVAPRWSKSLHRLTKIGRHIFYSRG